MTSEPMTVSGRAAARSPRGPDVLDLAWRYACSSAATAALLALAAATLAAAAIFPQQPPGLDGNTAEHWLTATAAGYGAVGQALRALGLFTILSGPWLRVIGALLAYHLLLRLAGHARYAWRTLAEKTAPLPPARLPAQTALLPIGTDAAAGLAARVLGEGIIAGETPSDLPARGKAEVDAAGAADASASPACLTPAAAERLQPGAAAFEPAAMGEHPAAQALRQASAAAAVSGVASGGITTGQERPDPRDARPAGVGTGPATSRSGAQAETGPSVEMAPATKAADEPAAHNHVAPAGSAPLLWSRGQGRRKAGYRVMPVDVTGDWRVLYGRRRAWAVLAPALAYLGCLLVLLALLLDDTAGWSLDRLALAQGMTAGAPAGAAASWLGDNSVDVRLDQITGPEGNPYSTVSLQRPGGEPAHVRVGFNAPALWGNVWLVQRETGPALSVAAQDDSGHEVVLQPPAAGGRVAGSVRVLFTSTQTEQVFAAPARNLAFRAVVYPALPERAITQTVFLVEAYRGSDTTPALSQLVRGQAKVMLDNVTYTFQEDRHAVFSMSYVPGAAPLAAGALLILAGAVIALWWGRAEAWISLAPQAAGTLVTVRASALLGGAQERGRLTRLMARGAEVARA